MCEGEAVRENTVRTVPMRVANTIFRERQTIFYLQLVSKVLIKFTYKSVLNLCKTFDANFMLKTHALQDYNICRIFALSSIIYNEIIEHSLARQSRKQQQILLTF